MYGIIKQDGFKYNFDPSKCFLCEGNCYTGESGYIWCTPNEIDDIASFLKLDRQKFVDDYIRKIGHKSSLKELNVAGSYNYVFLMQLKKMCQIYPI